VTEDIREKLERLESVIEEQQESIESQQEEIERLKSEDGDNASVSMRRRGVLASGGLFALLGGGGATARAAPTGQIGTASRPLDTLTVDTLEGPLVGGSTVESLVGDGIGVSGNSLYTTRVQSTEPPVGPQGSFWLLPSEGLRSINSYSTSVAVNAIEYGNDGFVYAAEGSIIEKIDRSDMTSADSYSTSRTINTISYGDNGVIYAGGDDNTLIAFDPANLSNGPQDSVNVGNDIEASSYGGGSIYVGGRNDKVQKFDPANLAAGPVDSYTASGGIEAVEYGLDGFIYAGGGTNSVLKLDPLNLSGGSQPEDSYSEGSTIKTIEYGGDGFVYAGGFSNTVHKLDPSNLSGGSVDSYTASNSVLGISYGDDFVYAVDGDGVISKLNPPDLTAGPVDSYKVEFGPILTSVDYGSDGFVYAGGNDNAVNKLSERRLSVSTGTEWVQVP